MGFAGRPINPSLEVTLVRRASSATATAASASTSSRPRIAEPIPGWRNKINSEFGIRTNATTGVGTEMHGGIDIAAAKGDPIQAAKDGKVVFAGDGGGFGNLVVIQHNDGTYSLYGHQSEINVQQGQDVTAGDVIGKVGSTGRSTGPHLHFEVRVGGSSWENAQRADPVAFLDGAVSVPAGLPVGPSQSFVSPGSYTGGGGGGGGSGSSNTVPASNRYSYGFQDDSAPSGSPVIQPASNPGRAWDIDELLKWVEENLWTKMQARIAQIDASPEFKQFLAKKGIKPGDKVTDELRKEFLAEQLGDRAKDLGTDDAALQKAGDALLDLYSDPDAPPETGTAETTETGASTSTAMFRASEAKRLISA